MAEVFSLYSSFVSVDSDSKFEVTKLINYLLKVLCAHTSSTRRHALTLYSATERLGNTYKKLEELIQAVEDDSDPSWNSYDSYTQAIHPLEQFLFKLLTVTVTESSLWIPEHQSSMTDFLQSIKDWKAKQTELDNILKDLIPQADSNPFTKLLTDPFSYSDYQLQDYSILISALNTQIQANNLTLARPLVLTSVKKSINDLVQKFGTIATQANVVSITHAIMLVYGALEVSTSPQTANELKSDLKRELVWTNANTLLAVIKPNVTAGTLEAAIVVFETFLTSLKGAIALPAAYLALRKSVKKIMRPYHAQTLVLLRQCRTLAAHFETDKTSANLDRLNDVITKVKAALDVAESAMTEIKDFTYAGNEGVDTAFEEARKEIVACAGAYQLTDAEFDAGRMASAKEADAAAVVELNKWFSKKPVEGSQVQLTIKFPDTTESKYTIVGSTRLAVILAREISKKPTLGTIKTSGFKERQNGGFLNLEKTVTELTEPRTLYLEKIGA